MSRKIEKVEECKSWYKTNKSIYEACGDTICRLLGVLLNENNILYHSINFRIKTEESFLNKCDKEKYDDPITQITDMCGLRIITYTNSDVKKIHEVITNEFKIDPINSIDKSKQMKDDQVGYLSIHYIATLKPERAKLSEYRAYKNLKFEIQVRTLLQHAWAEIEHDRNYKFSGELPSEIKRRFYLIAGTLELLDREFEQLSMDIDKYADEVREKTEKGNLEVAINSTSLIEYLSIKLKDFKVFGDPFNGGDKQIILELQKFGINELKDLDKIISKKMLDNPYWKDRDFNYLGALRDIMIIHDPGKYFEQAWDRDWTFMDVASYNYMQSINPDIEKYRHLIELK